MLMCKEAHEPPDPQKFHAVFLFLPINIDHWYSKQGILFKQGTVGSSELKSVNYKRQCVTELQAALGVSLGFNNTAEDIKTKIKNYQNTPFESSYPNQNQTGNCWQKYLDFHC